MDGRAHRHPVRAESVRPGRTARRGAGGPGGGRRRRRPRRGHADRRRAGRGGRRTHRALGRRPRHARLPGSVAPLAPGAAPRRPVRRPVLRPRPRPQGDLHPPPPRFTPLTSPEDGLPLLVRHYLRAYGPASPRHFARWAAAPGAWSDRLFASLDLAGEIERVDFEGEAAWVAAGDTGFPEDPAGLLRGVRLLPYFDAYGIAAQPRERLFPGAAYERALARGQAGNHPLLLVDGVVAGVWHQRRQGRRTTVTVEPLGRLDAEQERELGEWAERVGDVLQARPELAIGKVTVGPHA
ncbi:crosslink repair DNA glycosylase YcaQ family protein [Streptomyces scabiei]|uniref:DNA glycosylase AlkZ-like family protein n=1 Tax=Streptomyces scabiei TaxID=1930 RepID=UPI0033C8DE65